MDNKVIFETVESKGKTNIESAFLNFIFKHH